MALVRLRATQRSRFGRVVTSSFLAVLLVQGCSSHCVKSSAMAPTVPSGERVRVYYLSYLFYGPRRGDIVAFRPPGRTNQVWIMRVIGLPHDTVSISEGEFRVNGKRLRFDLQQHLVGGPDCQPRQGLDLWLQGEKKLPEDHFFVVGDNLQDAYDSRFWGPLHRDAILGRVEPNPPKRIANQRTGR